VHAREHLPLGEDVLAAADDLLFEARRRVERLKGELNVAPKAEL